jgi:transposase
MTMSRPRCFRLRTRSGIVLSVLSGEMTIAEAARQNRVSEQSVSRWKAQFLEGGRAGVAAGGKPGPSGREEQLQAQIDELTTALGQAHVELRVWKRSAERLAPSRTSR